VSACARWSRPATRGAWSSWTRRRRPKPLALSARARRGRGHATAATSAVPDVLGPGLDVVFCGSTRARLGRGGRAFRQPAQRLLAPAARGGVHPAPAPAGRAVRGARLRDRADERGAADDARLERPAAWRLRGCGRAARGIALELEPQAIAFVGKEAYRGAFGEAAGPRAAGAPPRRDAAVRVSLRPPRERRRPVGERLRWFAALRSSSSPRRLAARKTSTSVVAARRPCRPTTATGKCCSAGCARSIASRTAPRCRRWNQIANIEPEPGDHEQQHERHPGQRRCRSRRR
jgi:TDG/mug DNA glycosylase family protein